MRGPGDALAQRATQGARGARAQALEDAPLLRLGQPLCVDGLIEDRAGDRGRRTADRGERLAQRAAGVLADVGRILARRRGVAQFEQHAVTLGARDRAVGDGAVEDRLGDRGGA